MGKTQKEPSLIQERIKFKNKEMTLICRRSFLHLRKMPTEMDVVHYMICKFV